MPYTRGQTFKIDTSFIDRLGKKFGKAVATYDKTMEQRTKLATNMVWRIAHQKRPYISKTQMKAEGRSYRVSDPSATLGVPVAANNGGRLQASVIQKVRRTKLMSFEGEVATRGVDYAGFIEHGTRKMPARPFMRPAVNLTRDAIKRMYGLRVEANI